MSSEAKVAYPAKLDGFKSLQTMTIHQLLETDNQTLDDMLERASLVDNSTNSLLRGSHNYQ